MNELFKIEPVKSPRLRWMEKHGIKTHYNKDIEDPWCAWMPINNSATGLPMDPEMCGYGMFEGDALADLARRNDIKLWNEE